MKKFYDVHMHAFNLSHPNLLAFIARMNIRLLLMTTPLSAPIMKLMGKDKIIKNLLTMLENDIGDYFLILEYYLRQSPFIKNGNIIGLGNETQFTNQYQKIVLTPLIMDFGYKNILSDTFYKIPAQKPIIEQVEDLVCGINKYLFADLRVDVESSGIASCLYMPATKESKLFEIYPFIGINTANYTLRDVEDVLNIYFGKNKSLNADDLYNNMGFVNGFAGIKLYPPLGFDPWPDNPQEHEKVELLYDFCCTRNIPITTHCSDGGFVVTDKAEEFTNPAKWENVLKQYPSLKLNIAHMGKQEKKTALFFARNEWHEKVLKLINDYENVYMDFSCTAFDDAFYKNFIAEVHKQEKLIHLRERILFGTDFMVNLLWCDSYNSYLDTFCRTEHLTNAEKDLVCSVNPERFLFS